MYVLCIYKFVQKKRKNTKIISCLNNAFIILKIIENPVHKVHF